MDQKKSARHWIAPGGKPSYTRGVYNLMHHSGASAKVRQLVDQLGELAG